MDVCSPASRRACVHNAMQEYDGLQPLALHTRAESFVWESGLPLHLWTVLRTKGARRLSARTQLALCASIQEPNMDEG